MQWPVDSEWDPADPGEEEDDDYEAFNQRRMVSFDMAARTGRMPLKSANGVSSVYVQKSIKLPRSTPS